MLWCISCAGLGGITFHLGQFHIGSLFPRARGVVSGCAVGGFVGSGIIFLLLKVRAVANAVCQPAANNPSVLQCRAQEKMADSSCTAQSAALTAFMRC